MWLVYKPNRSVANRIREIVEAHGPGIGTSNFKLE